MHEDGVHAQGVRHQAGMLPPGPAKTVQRILGYVISALDRYFLDRRRHVFNRDGQEPFGHLFRAHGFTGGGLYLACQGLKTRPHDVSIKRLVRIWPEHMGEMIRIDLAQHHIAIGHRQGTAAPIAGRAGIGTGAVGTDTKPCAVEMQDGPAARRHRVDVHHRSTQPHARNLGFEHAFELAIKVTDVGGRAAHVKADNLVKPSLCRRFHHTHHAARRPGQNAVFALKQVRVGEPAIRLHEHQARALHISRNAVHIATQYGR